MPPSITFITSHPKKAEQLSWHLSYPIQHQRLDLPEIQSLDPIEVISTKTKSAYAVVKGPVLTEDHSLRFEALGKLPGPLIKWFLQELQPAGLCRLLDSYQTRTAFMEPHFGLCLDGVNVHIFNASMQGSITHTPRGDSGFGADAIFIPQGYSKTWGEMSEQEQIETSVRRLALNKLQHFLNSYAHT